MLAFCHQGEHQHYYKFDTESSLKKSSIKNTTESQKKIISHKIKTRCLQEFEKFYKAWDEEKDIGYFIDISSIKILID